jgi:hypothetical protein
MLCGFFIKRTLLALALFASLSFGEFSLEDLPLRFTAGASIGKMTPVMAVMGVGYENVILYVEGMGVHKGDNDFWCGWRGDLAWTFFLKSPFNLDLGVSGGYEYARAPNKIFQALNKSNDAYLVFPYNYRESAEFSLELRAHLYGFYSQIAYPVYHFLKHDEPKFIWRMGYTVNVL